MGAETRTLDIAGAKVEIRIAGEGPPLLYLHAGDGAAGGAGLIDLLSLRFRVFAPALAGFDGSDLPRHFSTVDDLSYQVLDLLEQLDLQAAILVGASFGGWVALAAAVKSQERISRLVLSAPLGAKFDGPDERQLADIFYPTLRDARRLYFADGKSDETDYATHSDEEVARLVRNRESLTLYGWSPLLHDPKLRHRLHRVRVPALLLWGSEDRVAPLDYGRRYAEAIPGAALAVCQGAGHYLHAEQPDWMAERMLTFAESA